MVEPLSLKEALAEIEREMGRHVDHVAFTREIINGKTIQTLYTKHTYVQGGEEFFRMSIWIDRRLAVGLYV